MSHESPVPPDGGTGTRSVTYEGSDAGDSVGTDTVNGASGDAPNGAADRTNSGADADSAAVFDDGSPTAAADGPAVPSLTPLRQKIYDTIVSGGAAALTVHEISATSGISSHTVGPRLNDLHRAGLVEPAGKTKAPSGRVATRWRAVAPERIDLVRERARRKPRRRRTVLDLPPEDQAQIVRLIVRNDAVNAILLADDRRSPSATRARRESRSYHQRKRQLDDDIKRAEREDPPLVKFLKAKRLMENATEAVRGLAHNVFEEAEARAATGYGDIADDQRWSDIRSMAMDHRTLADAVVYAITAMLGELEEDEDVIDVEAIDVDDWELPPPT